LSQLTRPEITRVVNRYIGVSGGYLGDFSYRTHAEFYPEVCGLDIDPNEIPGTTRERFIQILSTASPADQAKILDGVLDRFPVGEGPETRTVELQEEIRAIIRRLEGAAPVAGPAPRITSAVVSRAIEDAEALITSSGATSCVDRVHTALHGYLLAVCAEAGIACDRDASLAALYKVLRAQHPALISVGPRAQDVDKVIRSFSAVLDALQPIRNNASVAHPNEDLLDAPEAMLVVNTARTLLHYLDAKFSG
jgi:hypothetical protein